MRRTLTAVARILTGPHFLLNKTGVFVEQNQLVLARQRRWAGPPKRARERQFRLAALKAPVRSSLLCGSGGHSFDRMVKLVISSKPVHMGRAHGRALGQGFSALTWPGTVRE